MLQLVLLNDVKAGNSFTQNCEYVSWLHCILQDRKKWKGRHHPSWPHLEGVLSPRGWWHPIFYEDGLQPQNFSHRNFSGDHHKSNDCDTFSVALLVWAVESEKTNKTDHGPLSTPTWSLWGETGPALWMVGTLMLLKACHLSHHSPQPVPGREKASSRVVQNFTSGINSQLAQPLKPLTSASKLGRPGVKLGLELHFIHEGNGTQSTCHENPFRSVPPESPCC